MAQFRGTLQGARGEASRLGTKSSGLTVEAASWFGKIVVELSHEHGLDRYEVTQQPHHGHGASILLARGVVGTKHEVTA